jgi:hypothetical protein
MSIYIRTPSFELSIVMFGSVVIGLKEEELEHLARLGPKALKTSHRDIARVVSNKLIEPVFSELFAYSETSTLLFS